MTTLKKSQSIAGVVLSEVLKQFNISESELSRRSGINRQHINRMCQGYTDPTAGTLLKVLASLDKPVQYFYFSKLMEYQK